MFCRFLYLPGQGQFGETYFGSVCPLHPVYRGYVNIPLLIDIQTEDMEDYGGCYSENMARYRLPI